MNKLKEFIKTILYTGYIKGESPVSLLIIGLPESGKSSLVNRVVTNRGIVELTDIFAWGIAKMLIPLVERGIKIKHIVIPDFLVVMSKSKTTADRTLTFINSLVEEGIVNIGTYLNRGIEFKTSKEVKKSKVKCGIITSMTEKVYQKMKPRMNNIGFISRFVIIRYRYGDNMLNNIFDNILYGNYLEKEVDKIILPRGEKEIVYDNKKIHMMVKDKAIDKVRSGEVDGYGIRLTRHIKVILQAIALKNGKTKVGEEEWYEFLEYSTLINYSSGNVATIEP